MKVEGSAFYFGREADADEAKFGPYFAWLEGLQLQPRNEWPPHRPFAEGYAYRRRLFVNNLPDAWCGVTLSARATEFHHYVQQVGNVVNVVARENGPNSPVELNFFCLRKDSGKGIYSHYYGSYAFGNFLPDLWHGYRHFAEQRRAEALGAIAPGVTENEVRQRYSLKGKARYAPLFNPNSFDNLVRALNNVFEVRLTTYSVDAQSDLPVGHRINNVHKVYRLKEGAQSVDQGLLGWIRQKRNDAIRHRAKGGPTFSGSVLGEDAQGNELTIPFGSYLDDHLAFKYDEIGSFNVAQLANNPCLAAMLTAVRVGRLFRP